MYAVTARTVGHSLVAFFGGEAVEGGVETDYAVGGKAETPRQLYVSMAIAASVANVLGMDR